MDHIRKYRVIPSGEPVSDGAEGISLFNANGEPIELPSGPVYEVGIVGTTPGFSWVNEEELKGNNQEPSEFWCVRSGGLILMHGFFQTVTEIPDDTARQAFDTPYRFGDYQGVNHVGVWIEGSPAYGLTIWSGNNIDEEMDTNRVTLVNKTGAPIAAGKWIDVSISYPIPEITSS